MSAATPSWGLLALLGLGLAVVLAGDSAPAVPARWALLNQLHPAVRARFVALFRAIEASGWTVVLTSTWRAGASLDYHYFGLAADFNAYKGSLWLRMATPKAAWEASGIPALIRAAGFRWGGDFVTPYVYQGKTVPGYDPVHADLGRSYNIATLRARAKAQAGALALAQFDGRKVALA